VKERIFSLNEIQALLFLSYVYRILESFGSRLNGIRLTGLSVNIIHSFLQVALISQLIVYPSQ